MIRALSFLLAAGSVAVPAAAQYPGPVIAWFGSPDRAAVMARLEALCTAWQTQVVSRSNRYLVCSRDASGSNKMAVQASGNGYGGSASYVPSFGIHDDDRGGSRVEALQYVSSAGPAAGRNLGPFPPRFQKQRRALIDALAAVGGSATRPPKR